MHHRQNVVFAHTWGDVGNLPWLYPSFTDD